MRNERNEKKPEACPARGCDAPCTTSVLRNSPQSGECVYCGRDIPPRPTRLLLGAGVGDAREGVFLK